MAVPVVAKAAVLIGPKGLFRIAAAAMVLLLGASLGPVLLISGVTAFASPAFGSGDPNGPMVVGDWGKPEAPGYQLRRGYGLGGDEGCSICAKFHNGVDIGTKCGTPLYSIGPGTVEYAEYRPEFGYLVIIGHGAGTESWYAHMPAGGFTVAPGQQVKAGSQIGIEGNTGDSTGCHVHLEVRINGVRMDPAKFLAAHNVYL